MKPLFISIPHSGEKIPDEAPWLKEHGEVLLMYDVDRYVDQLYAPIIEKLKLPFVKTEWHRYAIDLNRLPDDVDQDSVEGDKNPSGKFPRGLHWRITTTGDVLLPKAISRATHDTLVQKYFEPFHSDVRAGLKKIKDTRARNAFHIDLHSMPSVGTKEHKDPGEHRADIVVSDCKGLSCMTWFKDIVIKAYENQGFKVGYNWPYLGGRVTETYGNPSDGVNSIQVELNRALYMNEHTKRLKPELVPDLQARLGRAIAEIYEQLPDLPASPGA